MAFFVCEAFGWAGTSNAILGTRYNSANMGNSLSVSAGPFGDGRLTTTNVGMLMNFRGGAAGPSLRVAFWMLVDDGLNFSNTQQLHAFRDGATTQCYLALDPATRFLQLRRGADNTLLATASATHIQNGVWHYIEWVVTFGAAGSSSLRIDGKLQFNEVGTINTQSSASPQATGWNSQGNGFSAPLYIGSCFFVTDDLTIGGPSRGFTLTPNADVSGLMNWTPSTGVTGFNLVDEIPPNGDTDYISSSTPGQQALFDFTNLPYIPAAVHCVQVSAYARRDDGGPREIAMLVRDGSTFTGTSQAIGATYTDFYLQMFPTNPATPGVWTGATVNTLQAGVELTV